jgi:hypothetical protein
MRHDWLDDVQFAADTGHQAPDSRMSRLVGQALELKQHGWTVVSDVLEVPIVMARRRLRWLGRRRLIQVGIGSTEVGERRFFMTVEGLGWVIRDPSDLIG